MRQWKRAACVVAVTAALAGCGGDDDGDGGGASPTPAEEASAGREIWRSQGCSNCHTLAAADATGKVGPNLDETLSGKSRDFIRTSIVDPDAEIAEGFSSGVMPKTFDQLPAEDLRQLVDFIAQGVGD